MTAGVIITGNKMTIANSQQENVDATEVADPIPITVGQTTDIPSTIIIKPHQNITTTTTTITQSTTDLLKEKLKTIKNNVRTGPSPLRQLLPIIVCLISFATVLSMLVIYMDTTEIRHQQFRLNMSRDYEISGVTQDNPKLIKYIREIYMKQYPQTLELSNTFDNYPEVNTNKTVMLSAEVKMMIPSSFEHKMNGRFIGATGPLDVLKPIQYYMNEKNWSGYIIEPDPQRFFTLRKQFAYNKRVQVYHACLSSTENPKEVTMYRGDSEVKINSVMDEDNEWLYSRVKCFPLYTLMLALNQTKLDLLSLGQSGHELEILKTIPFDKVQIEMITVTILDSDLAKVHDMLLFMYSKNYGNHRKEFDYTNMVFVSKNRN